MRPAEQNESFLRGGKELLKLFFGINFGHIQLAGEGKERCQLIDLFGNTAAILNSIVSNSYCRLLREQIHTNLPLGIP